MNQNSRAVKTLRTIISTQTIFWRCLSNLFKQTLNGDGLTWAQVLCWHCTPQCLVGFSPSGVFFVLGAVHTQSCCLRSGSYWEHPPNDYKIKRPWSDTSTVEVLLPSVLALSWATACIQDMVYQRFRVVTKNNKISRFTSQIPNSYTSFTIYLKYYSWFPGTICICLLTFWSTSW